MQQISKFPDAETRYRNALLWAFDRLGVDGGMTLREQYGTRREIGKVLMGVPSIAAEYVPQEWSESTKLKTPTG